jgi:drug/metabolite transporter (DMT)-like permease
VRTSDDRRSLGILAVSLTTVVWSLVPLVLKSTDMPGLSFAMYRLWFGVIVYVVVFAVRRRRLSIATIRACALGGVFFAADIGLTFSAFSLTSAANATIIGALSPVLITLAAARWFGERVERRDLVLVAASFAGVVVVAGASRGSEATSALGNLCAALSVISWTAYWLFSKRSRVTTSALEYIATVMLVAAITITPFTIAFGLVTGMSLSPPSGQDWLWIWLVTLIPGATGHLLVAWSHQHVEAWLSALITQSQPVIASVAAWIVLGEALTPLAIAGGIVVMAATAAIVVRGARRSPEPEEVELAVERAT